MGINPGSDRAAPHRQHRASRQRSAGAVPRVQKPRQRVWLDLERRQRTEQRPLCAVRLAGRLRSQARCVSRLSSAFIYSSAPPPWRCSRGSSGTAPASVAAHVLLVAEWDLVLRRRRWGRWLALRLASPGAWPGLTYRILLAVTCTLQVYLYALNVVSNRSWGRNMTGHLSWRSRPQCGRARSRFRSGPSVSARSPSAPSWWPRIWIRALRLADPALATGVRPCGSVAAG